MLSNAASLASTQKPKMLHLNGQRYSANQLAIFGFIILVFCVQSLNCYAIQEYLQNK